MDYAICHLGLLLFCEAISLAWVTWSSSKVKGFQATSLHRVRELVPPMSDMAGDVVGRLLVEDALEVSLEGSLPVLVVKQVVFLFSGPEQLFVGSVCSPVSFAGCLVELCVPRLTLGPECRLDLFPSRLSLWPWWHQLCGSSGHLELLAFSEDLAVPASDPHVHQDCRNLMVWVSLVVCLVKQLVVPLSQLARSPMAGPPMR